MGRALNKSEHKMSIAPLLDAVAFLFVLALFVFENETYSSLFSVIQIVFVGGFAVYAVVSRRIYASRVYLWMSIFLITSFITAMLDTNAVNNGELVIIVKNMVRCLCLTIYVTSMNAQEKTVKGIAFAGIVCAGFLLSMYLSSGMEFTNLKYANKNRIGASIAGNNVNIVGLYMTFAFSAWIYMVGKAANHKIRVLCILGASATAAMSLLTGSRKILIYYIIVLLVYTAMQGKKRVRNMMILAIVFLIGYYCILNIEPLYYLIGHKIDFFGNAMNTTLYNESDAARDQLRNGAWELFWNAPIWGIGFGNVARRIGLYAHNNLVEVLASGGIIGFAAYYSAYAFILVKSAIYRKRDKFCVYIFASTLGLLVLEWFQVTYLYGVPWTFLVVAITYCEKLGTPQR